MRKLTKRAVALVLMVAMLAAFMVPVSFASGTTPKTYTYDFRLDSMDLTWTTTLKGQEVTYKYGGTAHPQSNGQAAGVLANAYKAGTINWSWPGIPAGYKADGLAVKNYAASSAQFGGVMYNNAETEFAFDGLRYNSSKKDLTGDDTAWINFVIKAPTAGTYKVQYDSTSYVDTQSAVTTSTIAVHVVPFTAAMNTKAIEAPADFNADVDAYVASGDYQVGEYFALTNANVVEVGEITLGTGYDEYLVIVSAPSSKRIYLDQLSFVEVAETAETVENAAYDLSVSGGPNYATHGWDLLSYASVNNGEITLNHQNDYLRIYSNNNKNIDYAALKIQAPETSGVYDLQLVTHQARHNTTKGSAHLWLDVYVAEYTPGMTFTSEPVGTKIGSYQPERSYADVAADHAPLSVGSYNFTAGKDYVLYLKTTESQNSPVHYYLVSLDAIPEVKSVPKAEVNGTKYGTITGAAAAATSGQTVKMLTDYTGDLDLPTGVSLDLNGNTWTVSEYTATSAKEKIVDTAGNGVLKCDKLNLFGNNGGYMPLWDDTAKGYTMNAYTVEMDAAPVAVGNAQRFWFNVKFADADALALVANGGTKMTLGADVLCGNANLDAPLVGDQDSAENFAKAYATAKKANDNIWLYIDVTGLAAQSGKTLTLTPTLELNGQAFELTNGNFTYNCQ